VLHHAALIEAALDPAFHDADCMALHERLSRLRDHVADIRASAVA
jgi:hypothetical protein